MGSDLTGNVPKHDSPITTGETYLFLEACQVARLVNQTVNTKLYRAAQTNPYLTQRRQLIFITYALSYGVRRESADMAVQREARI
ncbi:hypothetical protein Y032_0040g299 [Ancylostoma ceylanicum]|uniref:Uncharacterized protein n=1 Tax=Ancylostoma ceylanicum TaxID=53326 RepID=A0A016UJ92_9BILA|nr:hypothetical protein Y032_0040g299 [Ancylostoma ceylanicum]